MIECKWSVGDILITTQGHYGVVTHSGIHTHIIDTSGGILEVTAHGRDDDYEEIQISNDTVRRLFIELIRTMGFCIPLDQIGEISNGSYTY